MVACRSPFNYGVFERVFGVRERTYLHTAISGIKYLI